MRHSSCLITLFSLLALSATGVSQDQVGPAEQAPPILKRAAETQLEHFRGRVEWESTAYEGPTPRTIRFRSEFAENGDAILVNQGDEDGWTLHRPDGEGYKREPQVFMQNQEGYWRGQESATAADLWKTKSAPIPYEVHFRDVRFAAVFPTTGSMQQGLSTLEAPWGTDIAVRWETRHSGENLVVAAVRTVDGSAIEWLLSGQEAPAILSSRVLSPTGVVLAEAIYQVQQVNGVTLPVETALYTEGRLTTLIQIKNVANDAGRRRPAFGPADMGLEPGMRVVVQEREGGGPPEGFIWNGESLVSESQWWQDEKAGRRKPGKTVLAERGGEPGPYATPEYEAQRRELMRTLRASHGLKLRIKKWHDYTQEVIVGYQFTAEQTQAAQDVLRRCEKQALEWLERIKTRQMELIEREFKAKQAGETEKLQRIQAEAEELLAPIDRLFETCLKPGLETIPTGPQRRAAKRAASSQPGAG